MSRKVGFDYTSIPAEQARWVQEHSTAISTQLRHSSAAVLNIGQRLCDVSEVLGPIFRHWVQAEFEWSLSTARDYMACARIFGDSEGVEYIQPSAMVVLSRRKVPRNAVDEAVSLARSERTVSKTMAEEIIARHVLSGFHATEPNVSVDSTADADYARTRPERMTLTFTRLVKSLQLFRTDVTKISRQMSDADRKSLADELVAVAALIRLSGKSGSSSSPKEFNHDDPPPVEFSNSDRREPALV